MEAPKEFNALCGRFLQDLGELVSGEKEMLDFVTKNLRSGEQAVCYSFLTKILADNHAERELQEMWFKTPAQIFFPDDGQLRLLLGQLRDLLASKMQSQGDE